MKIKIQILPIILISLLLIGCGFKKVHQSYAGSIQIENLKVSGVSKITNIVRNKIGLISSKDGRNKINLIVKLSKNKKVKEKNISDNVTKYEVALVANIKLTDIKTSKEINKSFQENSQYITSQNYSDTITSENKTTKELTRKISEEIVYFLNIYYKDK